MKILFLIFSILAWSDSTFTSLKAKISVSPLCPKNAHCFLDGTKIDLTFNLKGCAQHLSFFDYDLIKKKNKTRLVVHALNKGSLDSCKSPVQVKKTLTLPNLFIKKEDLEVHFLGV